MKKFIIAIAAFAAMSATAQSLTKKEMELYTDSCVINNMFLEIARNNKDRNDMSEERLRKVFDQVEMSERDRYVLYAGLNYHINTNDNKDARTRQSVFACIGRAVEFDRVKGNR